jgi:hypothetical protein
MTASPQRLACVAVAAMLCLGLVVPGCSSSQGTTEHRSVSKPFPKRFDLDGEGTQDFYRSIAAVGNDEGGAVASTDQLTSGGKTRGEALFNAQTACPFFDRGILVKPYPDRMDIDVPKARAPIRTGAAPQ